MASAVSVAARAAPPEAAQPLALESLRVAGAVGGLGEEAVEQVVGAPRQAQAPGSAAKHQSPGTTRYTVTVDGRMRTSACPHPQELLQKP